MFGNRSVYTIVKLAWQWLLVYFFVLLFLEDVKRSIVISHFHPHWLLLPIAVLGAFLLSEKKAVPAPERQSWPVRFTWLAAGLAVIGGLALMYGLRQFAVGWQVSGALLGGLAVWALYRIIKKEFFD